MGTSVYATVVYGVKLNQELVEKLKSKAREEGIPVDEWEESDEYEIGEWLCGKCEMTVHNGCKIPQYVLGFDLATTDYWDLGIFEIEYDNVVDEMNKAFEILDLSLSPKLYLVSCFA